MRSLFSRCCVLGCMTLILLSACIGTSTAAETPSRQEAKQPKKEVKVTCYKCGGWGGARDWCGKCEVCYGRGYLLVPEGQEKNLQDPAASD